MKRRGFTLIELLAVIVVLAIIALIATPIVMNVIKNAQKGAVERSAERYVDAVETAIATDRLENGLVADGVYTVDADGNLVLGDKTLTVEVSGDKPAAGSKVAIENGQVVPTGTSMTIGDYTVTINDKGSATATAKGEVAVLCTAAAPSTQSIYNSTSKLVESKTVGVQATSEAPYAAGAVYTCDLGDGERTFYVLGEDGDNVKLIMNENLGGTVAWITETDYTAAGGTAWDELIDNNTFGPVTANAALAERTAGWTKLTSVGGTVVLPSGQDMADGMGDTEWTDENHVTGTVGPDWMKTNLDGKHVEHACGYWTSTPDPFLCDGAFYMSYSGSLFNGGITLDLVGVRPVITISKSNMSL